MSSPMPSLPEQAYSVRNERSFSYPYISSLSPNVENLQMSSYSNPVPFSKNRSFDNIPPKILLPHKMAKNNELLMSTARLRKLYNAESPLDVVRIIRKQYTPGINVENGSSSSSTSVDSNGSTDSTYVSSDCSENDKKSDEITDSDSDLSLSADREEIAQALIKRDSERVIQGRKRTGSSFKSDGSRRNLFRGMSSPEWEDEQLLRTKSDMLQAFNLLKQNSLPMDKSNLFAIDSESDGISDGISDVENIPDNSTIFQSSKSELFRMKSNKKWSRFEIDEESNALQKQLAHLAVMSNSKKRIIVDNDVSGEVFNSNSKMEVMDDHDDRY